MAFSNIKDYLEIEGDNVKFIDPSRHVTIELHDKVGPLIKLAKMLGLLSGAGKPHVEPAADEKKWQELKLESVERIRSAMATNDKKKSADG